MDTKTASEQWIGKHVILTDREGQKRDALITSCHTFDEEWKPKYINVIVVSKDPAAHDSYGRQVDREYTSVPLKDESNVAGRHFEFPE